MADNDAFDNSQEDGGHRPRDMREGNGDGRSRKNNHNSGDEARLDRDRRDRDKRDDRDGRDRDERRSRDKRDGDTTDSEADRDRSGRNRDRRYSRDKRDRDINDSDGDRGRRDIGGRDRDRRDRDGRRSRDKRDDETTDSDGADRDRGRRDRDRRDSSDRRRSRDRGSRYKDDDRDSRYSDRSKDRQSGRYRDNDRDSRYASGDGDDVKNRHPERRKDKHGDRDRGDDSRERDRSSDRYSPDPLRTRNSDEERSRDPYYARVQKKHDRDGERNKVKEGDGDQENRRDERMGRETEQGNELGSDDVFQDVDLDTPYSGEERFREMYVGDKELDYARLKNHNQDFPDGRGGRYNYSGNGSVPYMDNGSKQNHEGLYDSPRDVTSSTKNKKNWRMILSPSNLMAKLKRNKGDNSKDDGNDGSKPDPMTKPPQHHAMNESVPDILITDSTNDTRKLVYGQDENEDRGNWTGKYDFILSLLGTAVGLGNVWRFPYLCYRNGGGAFLFPFLIMMVIIGVPLFFLEAALGQFSSCGAMTCWEFAPFFKGLGVAMVMISALTGIYYNMILGWSLHYMFASFTDELPWTTCLNKWNTKDCNQLLPDVACTGDGQVKKSMGVCTTDLGQEIGLWNVSLFKEVSGRKLASASEEYWNENVLNFSSTINNFGVPKWDLVLCLLLAWVICFFCLIKGIKTTGKVVYFTAIFPYVVLTILFFRGVTLDNAWEGISYFITPKFGRLLDANVWKDAANQIFFSLSIAGGGLITLSSYNRFHNNILRDSMIVAIGDSFTCVFGGFVIFSFLGYMAGQLGVGVEDVAADGAGLAFVVYPEAVSSLPPAPLWSILFFFMLLTLGLDSQFAMLETVLTGVLDQYPSLRPKKTLVILSICAVLFILGLPLTCPGGMYLLQIMDNYVGGMSLIILGFVELVAVIFVYGVNRFSMDIQLMIGQARFTYWKVTWCILSPLTILFIFVFMFVDYKRSTYGEDYTYPVWADVLGWIITLSVILCVPVNMIFKVIREKDEDSLIQRIKALCLPTLYWGPALPKHRQLVDYVDNFRVDPWKDIKPRHAYSNPAFGSKPSGINESIQGLSLSSKTTPTPSHTSVFMYPSGAPPPTTPTSNRRKSRELQYTRPRDPYPSRRHQQQQQQSNQRDSSSIHSLSSQPRNPHRGYDPHRKPREHIDHYRESRAAEEDRVIAHDSQTQPQQFDRSFTTGSANSIVIDSPHQRNSSFETIV